MLEGGGTAAEHTGEFGDGVGKKLNFGKSAVVDGMLDDDYTIIVIADHETGNLQLAGSKEELNNSLYLSTGHTGTAVPLYYKSTLSLVPEMLNGDYILNSQVFDLCRLLLNI